MVSAYAVLDDPDQWAAFSVPDPDSQDADKTQGVWHSQVVVEGMHCGSCALNVEKALCAVPGVTQVTVNGASQSAFQPTSIASKRRHTAIKHGAGQCIKQ